MKSIREDSAILTGPPPDLRYRRALNPIAAMRELWRARELVRTLAERELRARYKQAVLGVAWAVVTPLALMLVFTLFFARVVRVETEGTSYPLFAYLGLLPWTFFSTSINQGGQSLINNIPLLNKVYCPREVFPLSSVAVAAFDTAVALLPLTLLFVITGTTPRVTSVWVPVLLSMQVAFALGVSLLFSSVIVYLRDLRHALPILLQIGLFATPVAYGINVIPLRFQQVYSFLNPLAPVIDGYRRTILQGLPPDWHLVIPGAISSFGVLILGYVLFKRLEAGIADVA
jgi:ABC-2 type transport system permease protein/lipopolysaccharide transport system permease protein